MITAKHCLYDWDTTYGLSVLRPRQYLWLTFPQDRHFEVKSYATPITGAAGSWDVDGADWAIVTLPDPVPSSVVAHPAPMWTGSTASAISQADDLIVVGFGDPHFTERWYGPVHGLEYFSDPCDKGIFDGSCVDHPAIWHHVTLEEMGGLEGAWFDHGDSGGALFARIQGHYYLIGINSGYDKWEAVAVWAPVGKPNYLARKVNADLDVDGIPDSVDNCPGSACRYAPDCYNPDQYDADGDKVGEVCDNCPQIACSSSAGRLNCANNGQLDSDGDGWGDVCDLCPAVYSSQRDMDADLVGDECDLCPGTSDEPKACWSNLDCVPFGLGDCIQDTLPGGYVQAGRCARLPDVDRDGVPQACDLCPDIQDPLNANANVQIESETAAAVAQMGEPAASAFRFMGDVCEPVPQVEIKQDAPYLIVPPVQGAGEMGLDLNPITASTILGDDGSVLQSNVQLDTTFRHCSCFNPSMRPLSLAQCISVGNCSASGVSVGGPAWREVTMATDADPSTILPGGKAKTVFSLAGSDLPLVWHTQTDIDRPTWAVDAKSISYRGQGVRATHGVIATTVLRDEALVSSRDSSFELRTVLSMVDTPNYHLVDLDLSAGWVAGPCGAPRCLTWFEPFFLDVIDPESPVRGFDSPTILVEAAPGRWALLARDGALEDVSARIDSELVMLLASEKFAWVPASEGRRTLDRMGINAVAALVPREGSGFRRPVKVIHDAGVLKLDAHPVADELSTSASQIATTGQAVYSAMADIVLIAGGPSSALRRFSFTDGDSDVMSIGHSPESNVPGLVFDYSRQILYSLQINGSRTQLVAHDLAKGERDDSVSVALDVPHIDDASRLSLLLADGGQVAIVAGRKDGVHAWLYAPSPAGEMVFVGAAKWSAQLAGDPLPRGLAFAALIGEKMLVITPKLSDFSGGEPPSSL